MGDVRMEAPHPSAFASSKTTAQPVDGASGPHRLVPYLGGDNEHGTVIRWAAHRQNNPAAGSAQCCSGGGAQQSSRRQANLGGEQRARRRSSL
jgi:hypothetical protein